MNVQSQEISTLEEVEKRHVAQALEATAGNVTRTAKLLGVDRRRLYRMIARYGLAKRKCPTCGRTR